MDGLQLAIVLGIGDAVAYAGLGLGVPLLLALLANAAGFVALASDGATVIPPTVLTRAFVECPSASQAFQRAVLPVVIAPAYVILGLIPAGLGPILLVFSVSIVTVVAQTPHGSESAKKQKVVVCVLVIVIAR